MCDLSWLNPTPHAIAVYASQPLSPVATQHSLPSGRYSLLGPDLHRLDRTSFRLAHLLDHLVGDREQRRGDCDAKCLGGGQIDDEIELGRLLEQCGIILPCIGMTPTGGHTWPSTPCDENLSSRLAGR
jgi:hypothetical protein